MKKIRIFLITTSLLIFSIGFISFLSLLVLANSNDKPITHYLTLVKNQLSSINSNVDTTTDVNINNNDTSSKEPYIPSSYPNTSSPNYNKPFELALESIRNSQLQCTLSEITDPDTYQYFATEQYYIQKEYFIDTMKDFLSTTSLSDSLRIANSQYSNYTTNLFGNSKDKLINFYTTLSTNSVNSINEINFTVLSMEPKVITPVDNSEGSFYGFVVKYQFSLSDDNNFSHDFGTSSEPIVGLVGNKNDVLLIIEPW